MESQQELNALYFNRNLMEELSWATHGVKNGYLSKYDARFIRWLCGAAYDKIDRLKKHELTSLYIRDKQSGVVRRIGDDQHDMLCIDSGKLFYHNLHNGEGCFLVVLNGDYEFVDNVDDHGYSADPREV